MEMGIVLVWYPPVLLQSDGSYFPIATLFSSVESIGLGEAVMQDLVMDFSNIRFPKAYISKPYICDNAESEDYDNEEESIN